jgi:hypothetical protein
MISHFRERKCEGTDIVLIGFGTQIDPGEGPILELRCDVPRTAIPGVPADLEINFIDIAKPGAQRISARLERGSFMVLDDGTECPRGDLNFDGDVDLFDLLNMLDLSLGSDDDILWEERCRSDLDGDLDVDLLDVFAAVEIILE